MALANIGYLLAQQPKKVLMIDWDLEAPGLHRYYRDYFVREFDHQDSPETAFDEHLGLIELFIRLGEQIKENIWESDLRTTLQSFSLEDFIIETDIRELYFLKSGCFDKSYQEQVSTFDWEDLFSRTRGLLFTLLAERLTEEYDYVLIDSRTGITDISNICTMLMPETLVLVFTPNRQSLTGLEQLAVNATNYRRGSNDLRSLVIFPLPSRIETNESSLREDWRWGNPNEDIPGYQPIFEDLMRSVYSLSESECKLENYFDKVQIQQSTRFAYGEEIAVILERTSDSLSIASSYQRFCDCLLQEVPWTQPSSQRKLAITSEIPQSKEIIELEIE